MNDDELLCAGPVDAAYIRRCVATIKKRGHMVQAYGAGPDSPGLCYTIGLSQQDAFCFELVISGLPPQVAHSILESAVAELHPRAAVPLIEGARLIKSVKGYEGVLRKADTTGRFDVIHLVTGQHAPVWQIVWPDRDGAFPGEPGYRLPGSQEDFSLPKDGLATFGQRPWARSVRGGE